MSVSFCLPLMRKALLMTKPSSPLRAWVISISSVALKQQTTPTLFRCLAPRLFWPQLPRRARPLPLPEATNPFTHQPALGGVQVTAAPAATAWTPHPACIAKSLGSILEQAGTARSGVLTPTPGNPRSLMWEERTRSEEHTSELQSRLHLVCRLLLE